MASEDKHILHIETAAFANLQNTQIGMLNVNDGTMGIRTLGYKDGAGNARVLLVQGQLATVSNVTVTAFNAAGYVKNNASGVLSGGNAILLSDIEDGTFTQGSVMFVGATALAEDNANFFWDDTSNRLGLGTATPSYSLEVSGTAPNIVATNTTADVAWFKAENDTTSTDGSKFGISAGGDTYLQNDFSGGDINIVTNSAGAGNISLDASGGWVAAINTLDTASYIHIQDTVSGFAVTDGLQLGLNASQEAIISQLEYGKDMYILTSTGDMFIDTQHANSPIHLDSGNVYIEKSLYLGTDQEALLREVSGNLEFYCDLAAITGKYFKFRSNPLMLTDADDTDYVTLATDANGGLTITTLHAAGAGADISLVADGAISMQAAVNKDVSTTLTGTGDVEIALGTGQFNVSKTGAGFIAEYTTTDATASNGPTVSYYRDSASPAVDDVLSLLRFSGNDSVGGKVTYAQIVTGIQTKETETHDGRLVLQAATNGELTDYLTIDGETGIVNLAPSGALQINGSAGHTGHFDDGTNFRVTVTKGIITGIADSSEGGYA